MATHTFLLAVPLFWVLGIAVFCVAQNRRARMLSASENWPAASGRFHDGGIRVESFHARGKWYAIYAYFEYTVLGATYKGSFREGGFQGRERAEDFLDRIKAGKMDVRYNPANPKVYFVDGDRDVRA